MASFLRGLRQEVAGHGGRPRVRHPYTVHIASTDGAPNDIDGDLTAHWQDDDTIYEVERVIRAERVGQRYKIWFKWKNSDDHTWRWWSEMRKELVDGNPLIQEMATAVDAERDRYNDAYGNHDEFDEHLLPEAEVDAPRDAATPPDEEDHTVDDGLTIAQRRRPRRAHTARVTHVAASTFLQAWAYSKLCAAKAVVEDDFTLPGDWPSIANLAAGAVEAY